MPRPRELSLPVVQERSSRTRDRLLDAVEAVLTREGIDGATVPAIAEEAGVAVGTVYRRFPDKDALLRGAFERFFVTSAETNREGLSPESWEGVAAGEMIEQLVRGIVGGYRLRRALLRALLRYAETHPDAGFRRQAAQLRASSFRMIGDLLVARASQIGHPRPRDAVAFALTVAGYTLRGTLYEEKSGRLDGEHLVTELTRMIKGYLSIK